MYRRTRRDSPASAREGGATRRVRFAARAAGESRAISYVRARARSAAHARVSRSLALGPLRRRSVVRGRLHLNSNAPTDSRHSHRAAVSRSIVRDARGSRGVARIRERHDRARDEDGRERRKRIVTEGAAEREERNYRRKRASRTERTRGICRRCRRRCLSLSSAIARRRISKSISPLSDRERREIDPRRARTTAVKSVESRARANEIWCTEEASTWWKR